MWKRSELKRKAKTALKSNYWRCVLAAVLLTIALGTGAGARFTANLSVKNNSESAADESYIDKYYENKYEYETYGRDSSVESEESAMTILKDTLPPVVSKLISAITVFVLAMFAIISAIVNIFILNPLEAGGCNFFKTNCRDCAELNTFMLPFKKKNYWKIVGIMFLRNLFIILWSCLLIVPGIIKFYEYRMIPYILTDYPQIPRKEAFRISKRMMKGNKWNAFVLDLSFIGWQILSLMTCGIVGLLYVNPYIYAADAELFVVLKNINFRNDANRG